MEMDKYTAIACKVIEGEEVAVKAFEVECKRHDDECDKVVDQFEATITGALAGITEDEFIEWLNKASNDDCISPELYRSVMHTYGKINPKFGEALQFGEALRLCEQLGAITAIADGLSKLGVIG